MNQPPLATNVVIEQRVLPGSSDSDLLQKVATVYIDGCEYRVLAPPKALGEPLDWLGQLSVRQPSTESFNSEIVIQGAYRVLAIKLVKEQLEKLKQEPSVVSGTPREESRRTKLRTLLDDVSRLRLCGPSDDPDEQTSVLEAYRYLLINVKALSKGLLPSEVSEQLDAVPIKLETIYDVFESKAHLDAVCVDIASELENPTPADSAAPRSVFVAQHLIEDLKKVKIGLFDVTKLTGYCREINSSLYHGNTVACLLLMRTVLNHVPPVFGYKTFAEVTANAGKSLKGNLEHLESGLRKLADLYAHQQIRKNEQYPTKNQVEPFRAHFELLLHEVLGKCSE